MPTERLYEQDPYLREFDATVLASAPLPDGRYGVSLDRTAFYPEGGGQPGDRGRLGGAAVLDTRAADGEVLHVTDRPLEPGPIHGTLDWELRFDRMRQHTGQHLLSAAFEKLYDADTVGFHLGETEVTIDVRMAGFGEAEAEAVERWANGFIANPRDVRVHWTDAAGLAAFDLRKPPVKAHERFRLVELPGADLCPCGGTHVGSTGAIGLVKVLGSERRGDDVRVRFACGGRAFADYGRKVGILARLGALLNAPEAGLEEAATRLLDRLARADEATRRTANERNGLLAESLARKAERRGAVRVAVHAFESAEAAQVADLARQTAAAADLVAVIGGVAPDGTKAHLAVAVSPGLADSVDAAAIVKAALPLLEGRGGGNRRLAQGGGPAASRLAEAIERAAIETGSQMCENKDRTVKP